MFATNNPVLRDFTPAELQTALAAGAVTLIDVREPGEYAQARIAGALNLPLSSFKPDELPAGQIVLHCGVGKRSRMAAGLCAKSGIAVAGHLAGGLAAWAEAGLPVTTG